MIQSLILDVDNVLADSIRAWCTLAKRDLGIIAHFDKITNHKLVGCVSASPEQVFRLQDHVWANWRKLKPVEMGIGRTIDSIRDMGVEIVVATSGPKRHVAHVRAWLAQNHIGYGRFCSVAHKSEIKADALVDDAPDEALSFASTGRTAFLYDRPWNRSIRDASTTRIASIRALQGALEDTLLLSKHDRIVRSRRAVHAQISQSR